jgi:hypothetical protein
MGKEVIVDPTDTPEELTAEQLGATSPVIYLYPGKTHNALRAQIRAAGISTVARAAQVSRSTIKAFINKDVSPLAETLAKLRATLSRLRASDL